VLCLETIEPRQCLSTMDLGAPALRELEIPIRVSSAEIVDLTRLLEALGGKLSDRFKHPEALAAPSDEALVDERAEDLEISVTDLLRCLELPAAGEDGELGEQSLFVFVEQVVAPLDRRP
jgi:hypothetical protein